MATRRSVYAWENVPAGVWCWHIHHDRLIEISTEPLSVRADYIREGKAPLEVPIRLRLIAPVRHPRRLPKAVLDAGLAYAEAGLAYAEAGKPYDKVCEAGLAYDKVCRQHTAEIEALHAEECPDCPWNGKTIFPDTPKY